jgi:hypothetical protein
MPTGVQLDEPDRLIETERLAPPGLEWKYLTGGDDVTQVSPGKGGNGNDTGYDDALCPKTIIRDGWSRCKPQLQLHDAVRRYFETAVTAVASTC